jgi:hypothetical protein
MGWWSSSEEPGVQTPLPDPAANTPSTAPTPAIPLSRDEQAYEELKELFAGIDPEKAAAAAIRAKEIVNEVKEDNTDSIYSSTMKCSQCFDQAFYCSSIGGQLNNVYRFGALRSCSDLWQQWRFCMRTKVMSDDTKKEKVREYNMQKQLKFKIGRSSEDVWEVRKEPVPHPFSPGP